jgi:hypothetical protein
MICEWDLTGQWKTDESQQCVLFTLKHLHNIHAGKFSLKHGKKHDSMSHRFTTSLVDCGH